MPTAAPAPIASKPTESRDKLVMPKRAVLRGFIRKAEDGSYEGICLTLNLPARGHSMDEVEQKLRELIVAYLRDAVQDGTWDEFVPRRAPFSYYAAYYWYNLLASLDAINDFKLFIESAPCSAHA